VGKFYPPVSGGMERVLESLCLVSAGLVESAVLVSNTGRNTVREEVNIDGWNGHPDARARVTRVGALGAVGSVHIAPDFVAELRRTRADLILLHEPNPWGLLAYALARPAAPLAIWYHSDVVRPALQYALFYAPLAKFAYGRAERIVVSSPALAEQATRLAPYRERVCVIPFGIDPAAWAITRADHDRMARADGHGETFVLFAGRHVPYKGLDVLLHALQAIDVRAVIVGDGPSRHEWQLLASRLGLDGRVRFEGEVSGPRLRALMQSCAALVLPSVTRAEAFGYVQLEAMACGKPVISTDVPSGVSWVNQHDRTGLVVPAGDAHRLSDALSALMSNPDLRARLGDAGRLRVEREFSLAALRTRMTALYESFSLLENRRAAC
jgi:rhamnosyl/mannosyltransferase